MASIIDEVGEYAREIYRRIRLEFRIEVGEQLNWRYLGQREHWEAQCSF